MTILQGCKLTYFSLAGRGEATRLALAIGGIQFEDHRVEFPQWGALKPTTPWGSLPVLKLSTGQEIAQQRSVLRLVGKEVGLYPTDDNVKAALVDSLMDACEDVGSKTTAEGQGLEKTLKEEARAKAFAKGGAVCNLLDNIEKFIGMHGKGGYAVGDSLTIADIFVFTSLGAVVSGLYDGVPVDALDSGFPNINAVRKTVRSQDAVVKWYAERTMPKSYGPFN
jgi:prostaglandin-H2 D-isomerase / glutathione transferase